MHRINGFVFCMAFSARLMADDGYFVFLEPIVTPSEMEYDA
jgi:hypothetical protein